MALQGNQAWFLKPAWAASTMDYCCFLLTSYKYAQGTVTTEKLPSHLKDLFTWSETGLTETSGCVSAPDRGWVLWCVLCCMVWGVWPHQETHSVTHWPLNTHLTSSMKVPFDRVGAERSVHVVHTKKWTGWSQVCGWPNNRSVRWF